MRLQEIVQGEDRGLAGTVRAGEAPCAMREVYGENVISLKLLKSLNLMTLPGILPGGEARIDSSYRKREERVGERPAIIRIEPHRHTGIRAVVHPLQRRACTQRIRA